VQRCRVAEVHRCRDAKMQRWRGGSEYMILVQRCRAGVVEMLLQKVAECRGGAEVHGAEKVQRSCRRAGAEQVQN